MNLEQKKLLTKRLRESIEKQPEIKRLNALLLRLGGDFLVAPPKPDQDIPLLLDEGFVTSGVPKLKLMKSSSCHQNMATVWKKKQFGIVAIVTGYALSEDGLWRQHVGDFTRRCLGNDGNTNKVFWHCPSRRSRRFLC